MSHSNSMRILRRPSALEVMDMRQKIYRTLGNVGTGWVSMMLRCAFPDQRQFDAKPVSAIQHFI